MAILETFRPPSDGCLISMEKDVPETLFHYTSLENLALILENRTIRLFPLTNMNDPEECLTSDNTSIASRVFVSCWSSDRTESIPMWKLYTDLSSGVRIEMQNDPFVRYVYTEDKVSQIAGGIPHNGVVGQFHFLPIEMLFEQISVSHLTGQNVLNKVQYTDDLEYIRPRIHSIENKELYVATDRIGRYKNTYWKFQNEWRYILVFSPISLNDLNHIKEAAFNATTAMLWNPNYKRMQYYDLHIRQDAIESMIITASPRMSLGNKLLLDGLLEKIGLQQNLKESDLKGRL